MPGPWHYQLITVLSWTLQFAIACAGWQIRRYSDTDIHSHPNQRPSPFVKITLISWSAPIASLPPEAVSGQDMAKVSSFATPILDNIRHTHHTRCTPNRDSKKTWQWLAAGCKQISKHHQKLQGHSTRWDSFIVGYGTAHCSHEVISNFPDRLGRCSSFTL